MITVLRHQPMNRLTSALDRAVEQDASLAAVRSVLLQPLKMLAAFAAEAEGALGDDSSAIERLRLMLSMAAGKALAVKRELLEKRDARASSTGGDALPASSPPDPGLLCEPGLIDLGALVVVGLAAGRVGRRLRMPGVFVDTVLGIALSAAPAESIARTLAAGLGQEQIVAVLGGLFAGNGADAKGSVIVPTFLDPCERARWRCLESVFADVRKQAQETLWEGADSSMVASVASGESPDSLVVTLRRPDASEAKLTEFLRLAKRQVQVVFASPGRAPLTVSVRLDEDLRVVVPIPAHARAGWLGITTKAMRDQCVEDRIAVQEHWRRLADALCLRDSMLPLDAVASSSGMPPTPPSAIAASWGVRIVDLRASGEQGGPVRAGEAAEVTATLSTGSLYRAELVIGTTTTTMSVAASQATMTVPAAEVRDGAIARVRVFSAATERVDDERELVLRTAAPAQDGTTASPVPGQEDTQSTHPEVDAVDVHAVGSQRPFVVVRPAFVRKTGFERVLAASADSIVGKLGLDSRRLSWLGDDELVSEQIVDDPDGAGTSALLERLDLLAARTSGLEDASWVALVPSSGSERYVWKQTTSESARQLVVATPQALKDHALELEPPPGGNTTLRLRIIGRIDGDGLVITEPVRAERRAAGAGAEHVTDIVAVGIDAQGRDVISRRVRTVHPTRSGVFVMLLPVTDDIVAVEFRQEPELIAVELRAQPQMVAVDLRQMTARTGPAELGATLRIGSQRRTIRRPLPVIARPAGEAALDLAFDESSEDLSWIYRQDRGVRPRYEVELRALTQRNGASKAKARQIWRPIMLPDPFASKAHVALDRVGPDLGFDRLRLVASDGWNVVAKEHATSKPPSPPPPPGGYSGTQLRIRSAGKLRYWADLFFEGAVTWEVTPRAANEPELIVSERPQGATVSVPAAFIGRELVATVEVDDGSGRKKFQDRIPIGAQ